MDLTKLTVKDLNEICKQFGIRTGGRKADIIARLRAHPDFQKNQQTIHKSTNKREATEILERGTQMNKNHNGNNSSKKQKSNEKPFMVAVDAMFDQFEDPEEHDTMTDDGILNFCEAIGVDSQDPIMLVLSWLMEAKKMCEYTRQEFQCGMEKMGTSSLEAIKGKRDFLQKYLQDKKSFISIYLFCFDFAKEPTQKSLNLEIALGLWEILLQNPFFFRWKKEWLEFVQATYHNAISKDLWKQTLEFGLQIHQDLTNYDDENGAWPVLIDEFVDHLKKKTANNNTHAMEIE